MRGRGLLMLSLLTILMCSGCAAESPMRSESAGGAPPASPEPRGSAKSMPAPSAAPTAGASTPAADIQDVSLEDGVKSQTAGEAFNRKIIRNAEMTIQVDDPSAAQQKVSGIAESNGGFIVTSEISQAGSSGPLVNISMRVPAERFGAVLEALHSVGNKVVREKSTGQDVTEEYIDLEARIRTKQALEAQFLEIMKQARTVSDALEVQTQIAEVRGEIERLEGRRRFLENQSSLSTISLTLQSPSPVVATSGSTFGDHIRRAFGDSVDTASAIVIGFIRLLGVGIPVFLLILLPAFFVLRFIGRRVRARIAARPQAPPQPQPFNPAQPPVG